MRRNSTLLGFMLCAVCSACVWMGFNFIPALFLFMPALIAFIGLRFSTLYFIAAAAFTAVSAYFNAPGVWEGAGVIVMALIPGYLIMTLLRRRRPYRTAVCAAAAGSAAGMYCALCVPSLIAYANPFAALENSVEEIMQGAAALLQYTDPSAVTDEAFMSDLASLIPDMFMPGLIVSALASGLACVVICRALMLKTRYAGGLKPMARFRMWRLSKSFCIGCLVLFAGALIVLYSEINGAYGIWNTVLTIIILPFALQGISYQIFIQQVRKPPLWAKLMFWAPIALLFPVSLLLLAALGLIEQARHLRARILAVMEKESRTGGKDGRD